MIRLTDKGAMVSSLQEFAHRHVAACDECGEPMVQGYETLDQERMNEGRAILVGFRCECGTWQAFAWSKKLAARMDKRLADFKERE